MAELAIPLSLMVAERAISLVAKFNVNDGGDNIQDDVEIACKCLRKIQAYLGDSEEVDDERSLMRQNRVEEVQNLAYEIEDALDKFMAQVPHHFHNNIFSQKLHEIAHYRTERNARAEFSTKIKNIEVKINSFSGLESLLQPPCSTTRQRGSLIHQFLEEEEIVGFEEPRERISKQLKEVDLRLLLILIVGPGGSGKSTVVKNVYESDNIQKIFDGCAWIDVSRPSKSEEDQKAELSHLKGKRFVVVLDNVWTTDDVERITNVLPEGLLGSKVIITTRISDIAAHRVGSSEYIHDLSSGLLWKDAWSLFCNKAFKHTAGYCPPELEEWVKKFLKKCEGLPFAISAIATLLSKKPQTPFEWKKLHESLGSAIRPHFGLSIISRVLQPSYTHLPSHLKMCFLYFGMFPEDYSISCHRLIRLWLAEGFITPGKGQTPEEAGETYLSELIGRNLVQATTREMDGRVRAYAAVHHHHSKKHKFCLFAALFQCSRAK